MNFFSGAEKRRRGVAMEEIREKFGEYGLKGLRVYLLLACISENMPFSINDQNYQDYKRIYEIIWKHKSKYFSPELIEYNSPIDVLNGWEKKSKQLAKRGLKEGLRDTLSMIKEFPAELKNSIDQDLEKNKLPGLLKLQSVVKDTIGTVMKRGSIKNLDEYYIVKEIVIDQTSELSEQDRGRLFQFMGGFEQKNKKSPQ